MLFVLGTLIYLTVVCNKNDLSFLVFMGISCSIRLQTPVMAGNFVNTHCVFSCRTEEKAVKFRGFETSSVSAQSLFVCRCAVKGGLLLNP